MKRISTIIVVVATVAFIPAYGEDKVQKAIEEGLVTSAFLNTLTDVDVPDKWRERVEMEEKDTSFLRTHFRGDLKRLTVMWSKDWVNDKSKMFVARVYDGDISIGSIVYIGDRSSIFPADSEKGYEQIVSLKDDGTVIVEITHDDGYFEAIRVNGRETRLMGDLEYTKAAISLSNIVGPLVDSIQERKDTPAKKQKSKKKRKKSRLEGSEKDRSEP